jgi:hypothetical protein
VISVKHVQHLILWADDVQLNFLLLGRDPLSQDRGDNRLFCDQSDFLFRVLRQVLLSPETHQEKKRARGRRTTGKNTRHLECATSLRLWNRILSSVLSLQEFFVIERQP